MKNILILGNGFDLAHDLNTSYQNFIDFCESTKEMKDLDHLHQLLIEKEFEKSVLLQAKRFLGSKSKEAKEFIDLCKDNYWLDYVLQHKDQIGKRWCDFEYIIFEQINFLAFIMKHIEIVNNPYTYQNINHFDNILELIEKTYEIKEDNVWKNIEKLREYLLKHLNNLTWMLEIYLTKFLNRKTKKISLFEQLKVSCVLSFNYTDTYYKLYGKNNLNISYHYIHGKAVNNRIKNDNNMVFGIGDSIDNTSDTNKYEFLDFQKYYQRIIKKTGVLYKEWLNNVDNEKINIIIYGHSLDIVDGDVIKDLVNCPNAKIIIFYLNQQALKDIVTNLIKILGKDMLIALTSTKEIVFFQTNELVKANKHLNIVKNLEIKKV